MNSRAFNRITILLVCILGLCVMPSFAAPAANNPFVVVFQNEDKKWIGKDGVEIELDDLSKINTEVIEYTGEFEMWHHSGKYWSVGTALHIYDSRIEENYINFNDLLKAQRATFEFPIPDGALEEIEKRNDVYVAVKPKEESKLDIKKIFYLGELQEVSDVSVSGNTLTIKMPVKFNFMRNVNTIVTLEDISKSIGSIPENENTVRQTPPGTPVPAFGHGKLMGALWTRRGADIGGVEIYYYDEDENNFMISMDDDKFEPHWWLGNLKMSGSDAILDSKYDYDEVYRGNYHGNEVSVGHGTFEPLGAVGVRFYYPLEIEYYTKEPYDIAVYEDEIPSSAVPGESVTFSVQVESNFPDDNFPPYPPYRLVVNGTVIEAGEIYLSEGNATGYTFSFTMPGDKDADVVFGVNTDGTNPV
ncbi:MAG: hypothetical protein FWH52_02500, partial [Synergistaceae bacterium]|nr:hypothetical protein [Synergistaceae bacterium]